MKNTPSASTLRAALLIFVFAIAAFAQADPWTASANNLKTAFTGPLATALIAVAVVVAGLTFAFSEAEHPWTGPNEEEPFVAPRVVANWEGSGGGSRPNIQWCGTARLEAWSQVPCTKQWLRPDHHSG